MLDLPPFPKIDPRRAALANALVARYGRRGEDNDGGDFAASAMLTANGTTIALALSDEDVDDISDAALAGWRNEDPAALPRAWRTLAAASHLLTQADLGAEWIAAETDLAHADETETPAAQSSTPRSAQSLALPLALPCGRAHRRVALTIEAVGAASGSLLSPPPRPTEIAAPARLALRLPPVRLSAPEAAKCAPGDVLLPKGTRAEATPVVAELVGGPRWLAALDENGALVLTRKLPKEPAMKDAPYPVEAEAAPEEDISADVAELEEIPVDLEIRFALSTVDLSSFVAIGPGAVIDAGVDLEGPLDIVANGRRVGRGRLVRIGDRIGVEIEGWRMAGESRDD